MDSRPDRDSRRTSGGTLTPGRHSRTARAAPSGHPTAERDSISRNASFAFVVKMVSAAFTAVLTIFLVRYLGPSEYGVFALTMSVGGLAFTPSDLGISQATARYVAEAGPDRRLVAAVISDATRLKLVASGGISLLLGALAEPIADAYGAPEIAWPLRILALANFFQSFLLFFEAIFQALGRVSVYLRAILVESSAEAGLSIGLVLLGGGVSGAFAGRATAYAVAAGLGLILVARTIRPVRLRLRRSGGGHVRRIAGYGSALLLVDGAFTLFSRLDALLIGAIISVPAVGLFQAPSQIMTFLGYFGQSIGSGVAPRMTQTAEAQPDRTALRRALRIMVAFQGIFVAPLLVWAKPIADLILGPGYGESAQVLRALAPYAFLIGISPMVAMSVNYLGEARRRVPIAIAAVLINVIVDVALLAKIGIVAGALGTDLAYGFYVAAHLLILRRMVGLALAPLLAGIGRSLVACGAMALPLLAIGTEKVSAPMMLVGGILGAGVYVATLLAVGAVTPAELRRGAGRLRSLTRLRTR